MEFNTLILDEVVQRFLKEHQDAEPHEIALRKSPFEGINSGELASQIDSRQRCKHKLPTWYATECIYFPKRLSIEQSSSELAAQYKTALIPENAKVLDMTGGMGVDSFYFSQKAARVTYMERDAELVDIVRQNASILPYGPIDFVGGDSTEYIQSVLPDTYDLIYLDPARRSGAQKVFLFEDCEPDILNLQSLLLQQSRQIMVKAAPMLDIHSAMLSLHAIKEIHVLSIGGECKELLFLLDKNHQGQATIVATALDKRDKDIKTEHQRQLTFHLEDEQNATSIFADPSGYIFEPDAALLKSGAFKYTGQHFGLAKLHQHTHLYTSNRLISNFPGKISIIEQIIPYSAFKRNKKNTSATVPTAGNVITRNFPIRAEEIRKKHRIAESKDKNLYFCTSKNEELIVIETKNFDPIR